MAMFDKDQALAQHIKLSGLHEKEKQELIAAGRHSNVPTHLNLALGELDEEARRNGYVFRCWESDATQGFIHTIEKISSEFEQIRQELFRLNDLRHKADLTERRRAMRTDLKPELGESERGLVNLINASNPERITWDDVKREVAALEERIVRETGFGVTYWSRSIDGVETAGSYVLVPKNEGWLEAKRREQEESE